MGSFLLYLSSALIVVWTIQLARTKGRNPWLWGGASLLFMLFGFTDSSLRLVGLAPLFFLLFFRAPDAKKQEEDLNSTSSLTHTCPRCHSYQATPQRYCVNCGWEMGKPYSEEGRKQEEQSTEPNRWEPMPVANTPAEVADSPEQPTESNSKAEATPSYLEPVEPQEEPQPEVEAPKPEYSGPPTAAKMTERGMSLLNSGRFQEAIDQFTKAIALDRNYREAWKHRAEAYKRLGRNREADEDSRALEAI